MSPIIMEAAGPVAYAATDPVAIDKNMRIKKFFITGLPRSRTSWFSAFMTSGDVFCWHEAMNGCQSKDEFTQRMNLDGYTIVGNSDSGLAYTDFEERFPGAKTVIIERDIDEVYQSLVDAGIVELEKQDQVYGILQDLRSRLRRLSGLRINFKHIDNRIDDIYHYCTWREPDANRVRLFKNLEIEPIEVMPDMKSYSLWLET